MRGSSTSTQSRTRPSTHTAIRGIWARIFQASRAFSCRISACRRMSRSVVRWRPVVTRVLRWWHDKNGVSQRILVALNVVIPELAQRLSEIQTIRRAAEMTRKRTLLIRLSPRTTTGSVLSMHADLGRSWLSTCLSEAICRFRARCRSFSDCCRTKRHARPTLSAPDGTMGSSATSAARPASHTALPIVPAFSGVVIATVTRVLPPVPSWNVRTRRSRSGVGRPT